MAEDKTNLYTLGPSFSVVSSQFPNIFVAIRRCKEDLETQMAHNRVLADKEAAERDAEKMEQRRMVEEHVRSQAALKEASRQKLLVRSVHVCICRR